jgi:hypothetical protein
LPSGTLGAGFSELLVFVCEQSGKSVKLADPLTDSTQVFAPSRLQVIALAAF